MKIALAMIVKGDDREAKLLDRCLKSAAPFVDGIYITVTQRNMAVERVVKKYKGTLSYFEWINDFAAARNFNFAQVPKEFDYIMWSDADDVWRGMEKMRPTIAKHPSIDAYGIWYLYDWDEEKKPIVVHKKTMIVRNDGSTKWVGALHEELDTNREIETFLLDGIDRLHLSDDPLRIEESKQRNLKIAQTQTELLKDDPRSYWNLANAHFGVGDFMAAADAYNIFLSNSNSEDEKYLAHCRLSDSYKQMHNNDSAIRELQIAIGLLPTLPDAYLHLGYLYYSLQNLDKAEEYVLQGLVRKPLIHKMIVYNPRDYDYNPMMLLAQVYFQKNRPDLMLPLLKGCAKIYPKDEKLKKLVKEGEADKKKLEKALYKVQELQKIKSTKKLKEALDKLTPELRSHPAIAVIRNQYFIKTESSGRDLAIYCGQTIHEWSPGKGFIGGSEEAVINLSRELTKQGWNVVVYNNCGIKDIVSDGVTYRPFWLYNHRDKQDALILWRWARLLDHDVNATRVYVDLHDVVPPGEFNEKRLSRVTKIFVKSQFHRSLFPHVPDDKFAIIPNGIDLSLLDGKEKRDPMLLVNTSSPDRSMDVLPRLFEEVKKQVPKAKMKWAYGWELFKRYSATDPKKMQWMKDTQKAMKDAGIEDLGRLSQKGIGQLYQQATIFAYPSEFAEIDCISVRKAQAAGCFPITTTFGALDESTFFGDKVVSEKDKDSWVKPYQFTYGLESEKAQREWVDAVVFRLKNPKKFDPTEWRKQFEWSSIAARWHNILHE